MDVCVYTHRYVLISKHKKIKPGPNKASQSIHMLLMTNTFLSVTLETQDWKRSWHLGHSQPPPATHCTSLIPTISICLESRCIFHLPALVGKLVALSSFETTYFSPSFCTGFYIVNRETDTLTEQFLLS